LERQLRDCLGRFATGVAVITSHDTDGTPVAVTVNSFASLSLDPPLVLWSLDLRSSSLVAFSAAPGFIVHILAADQQALSGRFAARGTDKCSGLTFDVGLFGLPVIPGVHAVLECERFAVHDGGDHALILGEVRRFAWNDDAAPLIFYKGCYRELAA